MPKWGLAMQEGMVAEWHIEPGAEITAGQEIMDIETSKIANVYESPVAGTFRKIVVEPGANARGLTATHGARLIPGAR